MTNKTIYKTKFKMNKAKDIQEGNKLIAEFMGLEPMKWKSDFDGSDMMIWVDKEKKMTVFDEPNLYYHTSWDWLMPVVEKIDEVLKDMTLFNETLGEDLPILNSDQVNLFTPIKYVWESIIQFITWYNQNKTS